ncbi:hypothetical protein ACIP9C_17400 [Lysinibacillus sp. NPDC093210]|uniref:hypothetical protein n=1 Tax=Lysinibacillus sp. NPDC093210 TaxID=3364133 RepID=UPI00382D9343
MEGVIFMYVPDWYYLNADTFLKALGQAFFSLSVGIAVMIMHASYLPKTENIGNSAINVASMNIIISLLAGLVIFPSVFALGYTWIGGIIISVFGIPSALSFGINLT